jgi:hypothetical protein
MVVTNKIRSSNIQRWGFEYFDGKEYREVKMRGNVTVNNTDAYHTACIAGLGIGQTPFHGVNIAALFLRGCTGP